MFPPDLPVPTLDDALGPFAGHNVSSLQHSGNFVKIARSKALQAQEKHPQLSIDECTVIVLYTMEATPREASPYYLLNNCLRAMDRRAVRPWRDFVWLLLHALRKLPQDNNSVLMRGCKKTPAELGMTLRKGTPLQWSGFSSTATKAEVMQEFLGPHGSVPPYQQLSYLVRAH
mmetsp:Transcript_13368/g.31642  ORF Transcript_13368/g.31642 Transcript_13368/m.31642 type:complete len:173 (-) Transcript_13368:14-532(-)